MQDLGATYEEIPSTEAPLCSISMGLELGPAYIQHALHLQDRWLF